MAEGLSIGEVASQAGIRTSAIRYYEEAGLLPAPRRTSGQRRYDPAILDRLALIQFAQRAGFTISEIRTLFEGFEDETPMSLRWQILAREKLEEVEALMERAQRMRALLGQALACGCLRIEDCAKAIRGCTCGDRSRSNHQEPTAHEEALFRLVGVGSSGTPGGISGHKHEALLRAKRSH